MDNIKGLTDEELLRHVDRDNAEVDELCRRVESLLDRAKEVEAEAESIVCSLGEGIDRLRGMISSAEDSDAAER